MAGRLTVLGIQSAKVPGKLYDRQFGLFLQVYPTGAKIFQQRLQVSGKRRTLGLGGYTKLGLVRARELACQNWLLVHAGGDPFDRRQPRTEPTFAVAAETVIAQLAPTWRHPKSVRDWQRSLARFVLPTLGARRVSSIDIRDVQGVLQPIWYSRAETARRVRQRIRKIMEWCIAHNYRTDNPAGPVLDALMPRVKNGEKRHHAAVHYRDLPDVVLSNRGSRAKPMLRLLLEYLVLTAVRSGEARGACWDEIDFADATWTIPAHRMKIPREHCVPLSDRALAILHSARVLGNGVFVFANSRTARPYSDSTLLKRLKAARPGATVHGLRSSFRDWAADNVPNSDSAAEAALAHGPASETVAAYLRTDYLDKRRSLMQLWADHVTSVESS